MDVKAGSTTTEWKIVLMNYAVGVILMAGALWIQNKGKDATQIMALAIGFLTVNGMGYGAMRTMHKNKALETNGNSTEAPK